MQNALQCRDLPVLVFKVVNITLAAASFIKVRP